MRAARLHPEHRRCPRKPHEHIRKYYLESKYCLYQNARTTCIDWNQAGRWNSDNSKPSPPSCRRQRHSGGQAAGTLATAISRLIQDLEAEIGYALFTRAGPRVSPTEQGFLLYEDVEHTLISLRRIHARAEEIARGEARPLRLAATSRWRPAAAGGPGR